MRSIMLLDPSIASDNLGDHIIAESARYQIQKLFPDVFSVAVPTHLPASLWLRHFVDIPLRFALGSNLLAGRISPLRPHWDLRLTKLPLMRPVILMGVGWRAYGDGPSAYARAVYRSVLSRDAIHSVRDEYTRAQLDKAGIKNVLNTACPTMWDLTAEHCAQIPQTKSAEVVTTLTDYNRDPRNDKAMLRILSDRYESVTVWPQGYGDQEYATALAEELSNVAVIPPTLKHFDASLDRDVDYVGTRLHAGIRALQRRRRAIVIGIDNRATEMQRDFNLVCVRRGDLDALVGLIESAFPTQIALPEENISRWKGQFKDEPGGAVWANRTKIASSIKLVEGGARRTRDRVVAVRTALVSRKGR